MASTPGGCLRALGPSLRRKTGSAQRRSVGDFSKGFGQGSKWKGGPSIQPPTLPACSVCPARSTGRQSRARSCHGRDGTRYKLVTLESLRPPDLRFDGSAPGGGERHLSRGAAYAQAAFVAEIDAIRSAAPGTRNDTLNRAAFSLGQLVEAGALREEGVAEALLQASSECGLGEQEARLTISSGLCAGKRTPRRVGAGLHMGSEGPPEKPLTTMSDGRKATVLVPGAHPTDKGMELEISNEHFASRVLEALPPGTLYRRDTVIGELSGEPGSRRFRPVQVDRLRLLVDREIRLARWERRKNQPVPRRRYKNAGRDHAGLLLAAARQSPAVRDLALLSPHPVVVGADLEVCRPGWNPSGIFYDQPPSLAGLTGRSVSIERIVRVLEDLTIDFPFRDAASRQNFYGLLLTPLLRPAIQGNVPLHLVHAPLERTGKGLLLESLLGLGVLGRSIPVLQLGGSEEEREKRITSLVLEGESVVHLDNLPSGEVLDSASLCAVLTSQMWKGRRLGASETVALPHQLTLVASGNNVRTTGEIAKRTVPIALQPTNDHPEERRDFAHPDIRRYALESRRALLEALLAMIGLWRQAGFPQSSRRLGGFEHWVEVVGGILGVCGFSDFLANYREWVRGADDWTEDARTLVDAWWQRHESRSGHGDAGARDREGRGDLPCGSGSTCRGPGCSTREEGADTPLWASRWGLHRDSRSLRFVDALSAHTHSRTEERGCVGRSGQLGVSWGFPAGPAPRKRPNCAGSRSSWGPGVSDSSREGSRRRIKRRDRRKDPQYPQIPSQPELR